MSKREFRLTYKMGTCRSGRQIDIPDNLMSSSVDSFLDQFALPDRIDLLCMTEFLILKNHRLDTKNNETKITEFLNIALRKELKNGSFVLALRSLGLITSIDYARFGSRMVSISHL